jgi:hypothetical protein
MEVTIKRKDLITVKQVIKVLKMNKLPPITIHNEGWNMCIDELIEVFKRNSK